MSHLRLPFAATALAVLGASNVWAYELATHAHITDRAYQRSVLGVNTALTDRLGLLDNTISNTFFDSYTSFQVTRKTNSFETRLMPPSPTLDVDSTRIRGWLMRGAIREDDGVGLVGLFYSGEPWFTDPDPVSLNRFCNHFYDPFQRRGLQPGLTEVGAQILCQSENRRKAPDWALGAADAFAVPTAAVSDFPNHFSLYAAREYMWRALTLTDKSGAPAPLDGATPYVARMRNWASTFRALGHVIHLLQDMAQPQHTRNEGHGTGHASVYEKYLDARAKGEVTFKVDGVTLQYTTVPPVPLPIVEDPQLFPAEYPIPVFAGYSAYWSTVTQAGGNMLTGKGLADYSNRGFLTPGNWFNSSSNEYPLPPTSSSNGIYSPLTVDGPTACVPMGKKLRYLRAEVPDVVGTPATILAGASAGPRSGTLSLDLCVMDERAKLLMPRAAAYSAGLINHFFRGKLSITLPDEGVFGIIDHKTEGNIGGPVASGFRKIKLKVRNDTPDLLNTAQTMVGKLVAVAKFHLNTCYSQDLSGEWGSPEKDSLGPGVYQTPANGGCRGADEEIVSSDPIDSVTLQYGVVSPRTFTFNKPIPTNATDVKLQVVFRGALGAEDDAVVVETLDIGEPAFTSFLNGTDYLFCNNGTWTFYGPDGEFPVELRDDYPNWQNDYTPLPIENIAIAFAPNDADAAATPLLTRSAIPPTSFIRFVTLGIPGTRWAMKGNVGNIQIDNHYTVFPSDLTQLSNQVYEQYDPIAAVVTPTPRKREVVRIRNHRAAAGTWFYFSDGLGCVPPYPPDRYDEPTLLSVDFSF